MCRDTSTRSGVVRKLWRPADHPTSASSRLAMNATSPGGSGLCATRFQPQRGRKSASVSSSRRISSVRCCRRRAPPHCGRTDRPRPRGVQRAARRPAGDEDPDGLPRVSASAFDLAGRTALVTGARRGIEQRYRVRARRGPGAGRQGQSEGARRGRTFVSLRLRKARCGVRPRREGRTRRRRRRHPGQQRGNDRTCSGCRACRRTVGSCARGRLECAVRAGARVRPRHARAPPRQGRVRRLDPVLPRRYQCAGLRGGEVGVAGLTRALANEWAGRGVNVNAVAPGYVRTDNTQALRDDSVRYEQIA